MLNNLIKYRVSINSKAKQDSGAIDAKVLFRPYLTWIWPRLIGILGGLNTHCAISGQELSNSSRVLFTDENSEYLIGSICADPDREPTSNILGQKHRRQFQNEGKHFLIDSDQLNSDQSKSPNIDLIHKFIKSWLMTLLRNDVIMTSRLFIHFHWNIQECNSTCSFFNFCVKVLSVFFLECRT